MKPKRERNRLDKRQAKLPPHEQVRSIIYDHADKGDLIEGVVRRWWACRQAGTVLGIEPPDLMTGQQGKGWHLSEAYESQCNQAKRITADIFARAFLNWKPEFFHQISICMQKVASEPTHRSDTPAHGRLRLMIIEAAHSGPVNALELARQFWGVRDINQMTPQEAKQVESTRRTISRICKRLRTKTLPPGRPSGRPG